MIRGLYISETGEVQIIGENLDFAKIVKILPSVVAELTKLHREKLQKALEELHDRE